MRVAHHVQLFSSLTSLLSSFLKLCRTFDGEGASVPGKVGGIDGSLDLTAAARVPLTPAVQDDGSKHTNHISASNFTSAARFFGNSSGMPFTVTSSHLAASELTIAFWINWWWPSPGSTGSLFEKKGTLLMQLYRQYVVAIRVVPTTLGGAPTVL